MRCTQCGMSERNTVHHQITQFGYHECKEPEELQEDQTPSLLQRIEELERQVSELKNKELGD